MLLFVRLEKIISSSGKIELLGRKQLIASTVVFAPKIFAMMVLRLVLIALFMTCGRLSAQSAFDLSALPLFWRMADSLGQNKMLSEADWDVFFGHPLYQQIEKSAQRKKPLKHFLSIVFKPSNKSVLDSILQGTKTVRPLHFSMVKHLNEVKNRRAEIEAFARDFNPEKWGVQVLEKVQSYLPLGVTTTYGLPKIYVGLFENNGFGGATIATDLLHLMNQNVTENIDYLAHEAHHYYTNKLNKSRRPVATREESQDTIFLLYAFGSLRDEGIASLLDKSKFLDSTYRQSIAHRPEKESNAKEFATFYQQSPAVITRIDSLLTCVAEGRLDIGTGGKQIKGILPWGGHPTGMFMAKLIEARLGKAALLDCCYNTFDFMLAYQDAAAQSGQPVFAKQNIALIKVLRSRLSEE